MNSYAVTRVIHTSIGQTADCMEGCVSIKNDLDI